VIAYWVDKATSPETSSSSAPANRVSADREAVEITQNVAILGASDDRRSQVPYSVRCRELLGNAEHLLHFARRAPVEEVIIALPLSAEQHIKAIVDKPKPSPTDLRVNADNYRSAPSATPAMSPLLAIVD
jgi:hypothetical protein